MYTDIVNPNIESDGTRTINVSIGLGEIQFLSPPEADIGEITTIGHTAGIDEAAKPIGYGKVLLYLL